MRQKLVQFGIQTTGHIATAGLVAFLVLAWALTSPFVWLNDWLADNRREKIKEKL
jgi:hypothetical protein